MSKLGEHVKKTASDVVEMYMQKGNPSVALGKLKRIYADDQDEFKAEVIYTKNDGSSDRVDAYIAKGLGLGINEVMSISRLKHSVYGNKTNRKPSHGFADVASVGGKKSSIKSYKGDDLDIFVVVLFPHGKEMPIVIGMLDVSADSIRNRFNVSKQVDVDSVGRSY